MAGKDISDMSFDEFFGRGNSKKRDGSKSAKVAAVEATDASNAPKVDGSGFSRGRPKVNVRSGQVFLYIPKYEGGRGAKYEVSVEQDGRTVQLGRLKSSPLDSDISSLPTEFDMIANGLSPLGEFIVHIDGKAVYDMFEHSHMLFSADGMPISRAEDTTVVMYPYDRYLWLTDAKVAASYQIGDLKVDTVEVQQGGYVRVRDRPQKVVQTDSSEDKPKEARPKAKPAATIVLPNADPIHSVRDGKGTLHLYDSAPAVSIDVKDVELSECILKVESSVGTVETTMDQYDGTQVANLSGKVAVTVLTGSKVLASERYFVIPGFSCSYTGKGDIPADPQVTFVIGGVEYVRDIYVDPLGGPYPFEGSEVTLVSTIPVVTYDIGAGEVPFDDVEVDIEDLPQSIAVFVKGATKRSVFLGGHGKKVNLTPDWEEGPVRLDMTPIRAAVFDSPTRSVTLHLTVNSCPVRRFLTISNVVSMSIAYEGGIVKVEVGSSGEHLCRVYNMDKSIDVTELSAGVTEIPVGPLAVSAEVIEVRDGREVAVESVTIREVPFLMRDDMGDVWFYVSKDKRVPLPDGLIGQDAGEIRKWHSQIVRMNPELKNVSPEKTVKAFKDFASQ